MPLLLIERLKTLLRRIGIIAPLPEHEDPSLGLRVYWLGLIAAEAAVAAVERGEGNALVVEVEEEEEEEVDWEDFGWGVWGGRRDQVGRYW